MDAISKLRNHMEFLKLRQMSDLLDTELAEAEKQNLSVATVMERLLSAEVAALTERRIDRRIRESKLDERKILDDFDFKFQTGVDKSQIMSLAELGFILGAPLVNGLFWRAVPVPERVISQKRCFSSVARTCTYVVTPRLRTCFAR